MKKRVNFPCPDVLKTFSDAKLVSRTLFIPNRVSYSDRVYQFKIHSSNTFYRFHLGKSMALSQRSLRSSLSNRLTGRPVLSS